MLEIQVAIGGTRLIVQPADMSGNLVRAPEKNLGQCVI
jgi:hypothetical protein